VNTDFREIEGSKGKWGFSVASWLVEVIDGKSRDVNS